MYICTLWIDGHGVGCCTIYKAKKKTGILLYLYDMKGRIDRNKRERERERERKERRELICGIALKKNLS